MADVFQKTQLLTLIQLNPDKFLPIIDHAWKVFPDKDTGTEWYDDPQYNLGWDAGLLDGTRPYFMECWASCGITMMTYFISTEGMENASAEELVKLLTGAHLFKLYDPGNPRTSVMKIEDDTGKEFYSINVTVGIEHETYLSGGYMYPYAPLNEYNSRRNTKEHEQQTDR